MSLPSLTLSANATPGAGGQGLNLQHMIECFHQNYELRVFCQAPGSSQVPVNSIPPSWGAQQLLRVPLLRAKRDWHILLSESNHDRRVAAAMGPSDFFQGTSGQCLESLEKAKQCGARTILDVITLHNDDFQAAMQQGARRFSVPPIQHPLLTKRIEQEYEKADLLRVMSTPARNTFLARGFSPSRVFVAAPPVDLPDIPENRPEPDPFIISYVGLLEPAKGFHLLIDAFRKLDRPNTRLWLWGNTGTRSLARYMRQQMAECPRIELKSGSVRALGHEKVYGASSVLVHPSLADGFGYVVSEAMAAGIPVITTTATGASEWIEDGVSGFVVAPGDAEAIRERLLQLMDSPALRRDMGQRAREAMRPLTIERMRECYRQVLSSL